MTESNIYTSGCFTAQSIRNENSYVWDWSSDLEQGKRIVTLDASISNKLYGSSTTIQPTAVFVQYLIKY